jgi:hypothetical protein
MWLRIESSAGRVQSRNNPFPLCVLCRIEVCQVVWVLGDTGTQRQIEIGLSVNRFAHAIDLLYGRRIRDEYFVGSDSHNRAMRLV